MSDSGSAPDGAPTALAWLARPVTLLGMAALVVNDHVLKAAFPGPVTGKVSDVAGLLLAPPLVAVLLALAAPRLPVRAAVVVGLVTVGAGFAIVKTSGYAAQLASAAWSALAGPSLVRADVTDLLALPALALAWWSWTRARRHPVRYRAARLVRLLVVLPAATLAVAATSAVHHPYALGAAVVDGRPAVSVGSGMSDTWPEGSSEGHWWVSEDGAATWRAASEGERRQWRGLPGQPRRQACVPASPDRCYRVVTGHLRVEESDDGGRSWRTAWEVSDTRREPLARRYPDPGDVRRHFSSREVAVHLTDGGHGVVVANGRDGFVVRHPDGRWERAGFPGERGFDGPFSDGRPALGEGPPGSRTTDAVLAAVLSLSLGFLVFVVAAHLSLRGRAGRVGWAVAGHLSMLLVFLQLALLWPRTDDLGVVAVLVVEVVPLGALVAFGLLVVAWRRGAPDRWSREVFGAFLLTVLLAGLPGIGWLFGAPPRTWMTVLLALLATVPGLLLARRASRLTEPVHLRAESTDPPWPLLREPASGR
ncbi:hypothetical protein ACPFP2_07415 [Micromonospora citrea]|uniref:hypothetical protein n=1 Tax=Micromonospora citrea TaxID=47855 RepID=UPI003C5D2576